MRRSHVVSHMNNALTLSVGQCATLACLFEVSATKPGNVHRAADFVDTSLNDFLVSAVAIGPEMDGARDRCLGATVKAARDATGRVTSVNTNLGIILLLTPLAMVPRDMPLRAGVQQVLSNLNEQDAVDVYQAIRMAAPGGLQPQSRVVVQDNIANSPPTCLATSMRQAANWDLVARQYANGFDELFGQVVPWLGEAADNRPLSERIVHTHVRLMSHHPDSLIARKCGESIALESAARATAAVQAGDPGSEDYWRAVADLDFWLRSDGHRRNPGTSADLVTAGLFVGLRDGTIRPPFN